MSRDSCREYTLDTSSTCSCEPRHHCLRNASTQHPPIQEGVDPLREVDLVLIPRPLIRPWVNLRDQGVQVKEIGESRQSQVHREVSTQVTPRYPDPESSDSLDSVTAPHIYSPKRAVKMRTRTWHPEDNLGPGPSKRG